jgi:hypothetical protein
VTTGPEENLHDPSAALASLAARRSDLGVDATEKFFQGKEGDLHVEFEYQFHDRDMPRERQAEFTGCAARLDVSAGGGYL